MAIAPQVPFGSRDGSWTRKIWEDLDSAHSDQRGAITVIHDQESPFGEFLVVNRYPVIELNSSYGLSALRDIQTTTNGGSISASSGEIVLSTGTSANSTAHLDSAEVGRYMPGYAAQIGMGIRTPTSDSPTGTQVFRWGGFSEDDNNGFYFGKDATGVFVAVKRNGVETSKVYQSDWNVDKLDGTGTSGYNINTDFGIIYQIDFTWYGYGAIYFSVIGNLNGTQVPIKCHYIRDFNQTSVISPNLKVTVQAENGATNTDNINLYVGGRQYSIFGNYDPRYRVTSQTRPSISVGTTRIPLISFTRKSGFGDRSVRLHGAAVIVATTSINWEVVLNGSLTGASFGTPTNHLAAETALQSDISATAISGGHVLYAAIAGSGQGQNTTLSNADLTIDIPDGATVSLCAYSDSGTASVKSAFRLREEW